ncbi:MAG: hypothetical protein F4Y39_08635 [Gemmatimonadetes bacterium]|nr:hypothetical protein [Gemmatimonadota bacterium]MYK51688.1 hypothetical protein [Gemmatimonadota bacterium]
MVRIDHVVAALDRMDNWSDYNENIVRRLLGIPNHKTGVSKKAAHNLIDGLFPGHQHGIFRSQVKGYLARLNNPQNKPPGKSAEHCDSEGDNA